MEQRYVRNAIVKENYWKVENFFETKADGYVAASQEYETPRGTMLVVFKDRQAGFLLDSDTGLPITNEELTSELASLVKEGSINESFDDIYPDAWVLIGVKGIITDDEWLNEFGFTADQIQDVEERMTDLENYFEDTEEEM
ncbi:MAG: hypothetical protein IKL53_02800 [Lachnospiraceae bacterium]|nr:hypothetical protein [Lachnospiraceae bacterium]